MLVPGRRVVVTGASRGIGEALARRFAGAGADLVLVARSEDKLRALAEEVNGVGIAGDLTDPGFRTDLVDEVHGGGPIDVWINNAGLAVYGAFAEQDPADIVAVMRLNLEAPIDLCRRVLPGMLERRCGHVVNVSSVAMAVTTPGFATYGASKSGLSAFDASLAVELEGTGVGLTTVEIGEVDTEMLRYLRSDPEIDAIFARTEKLGAQRLLQPDDVADAIADAIEENKRYVRLPRRAAVFPAWVNGPRTLSNLANRWLLRAAGARRGPDPFLRKGARPLFRKRRQAGARRLGLDSRSVSAPTWGMHPDQVVMSPEWSDLAEQRSLPEVDRRRLEAYRRGRIEQELRHRELDMVLIHNPVSLRYAYDYRSYQLFQSRTPTTYAFFPLEGPHVLHEAIGSADSELELRSGRALCYFDGGEEMAAQSKLLAADIVRYLDQIGATNRRIGLEYINPTVTQELERVGVEVVDGMNVTERARLIKSDDEIACMRWAVAVAELGISKVEEAIAPGVTETQLFALLNYTNVANDGDWHDGRMLASGPRTNPWLQEATRRRVEPGDLVAFDTDMVGPYGYFADISRTMFCGPGRPSARQRELYRHAVAEIEHNMALVRAGITFTDYQKQAYVQPEEFWEQAYVCVVHAVGMCDEYPRIDPIFRGPNRYDDMIEAGMVLCIESYVGAMGERDGVKLEQQVLVTEDGCEMLSSYPYDDALMS